MTVSLRQGAIVAGVDGSASALHAVCWAAREAARWHTRLRLMHVSYLVPEPARQQLPNDLDVFLDQPRQWLAQAEDAARAVAGELEVTTELRGGTVSQALIEDSASARLIVLGQRGLEELSDLLLGSVPAAVAVHAHCPVVVVRSSTVDPPPADGPVVVGVDGSALSDAAVGFAIDAAASRGVPLVAVHALPTAIDWKRLAAWQEKYPDVEVRRVVVEDRPARALLDAAHEAQLLVVGSRGRGTLASVGLGSVSHTLLRHAPCPIATVRFRLEGTEKP